jgi:AcrR family transcriptional regulator
MRENAERGNEKRAKAILDAAAKVFSEKGYHAASMRDIASEAGSSLAGMYYYYPSKEDMLFSIQSYCFAALIQGLNERLEGLEKPEQRLAAFVHNHLEFFTANVRAMRVLSHESESLQGAYSETILEMKREYFHLLGTILSAVMDRDVSDAELRQTVLSIFGMVNWIYTWYDPQRDGTPAQLGDRMFELIHSGLRSAARS